MNLYDKISDWLGNYLEKNNLNNNLKEFIPHLRKSFDRLQQVTSFLASKGSSDPDEAAGVAVDCLKMFSLVAVGYIWTRYAEISYNKLNEDPENFYKAKIASGKYYMTKILPETGSLMSSIVAGAHYYNEYDDSYFDLGFKI